MTRRCIFLTSCLLLTSIEMSALAQEYQKYIDGQFRNSVSGRTRVILDPANGDPVATVPEGVEEDSVIAIKAARAAFDKGPWRTMEYKEREALVRRVGEKIRERASMFAELEVRNNGKPYAEALEDVIATAELFEQYATWATTIGGEVVPFSRDRVCSVIYEPIGVCAGITPWNYPLNMTAWKVAPALATGNTVVLKPSELTPVTTLELAKIFHELKFPPGVVNIVTGTGAEAGAILATHPLVDRIAFTGGTETGKKISVAAAGSLKKCSLELGGKSAQLVFADADLEKAANGVALGIFYNQGEVCSAGSRLLVEESVHDRFVEMLVARASKIKLGHGMNRDTQMGPLVSAAHQERVLDYIRSGRNSSAKLLIGGGKPEGDEFSKGNFVLPTIFDRVTPDMKIAREEIFGPVLAVLTFPSGKTAEETEENAVRMANDSEYGLAAGVWTENGSRADRVASGLDVGIVWVNDYNTTANQLPWGGRKKSGHGSELGWDGLKEYLQPKQIMKKIRW